jgi:DNA-binding transcriptional MerR regulator
LECTPSPNILLVTHNAYAIGEFAQLCGLSTHTIRFYERVGVLRPAWRAANGHRRYPHSELLWVAFVHRLKRTGMPLADITAYAHLREQGDATLPQRLAMLQLHRERLATQLHELSDCAHALDDKVQVYQDLLAQATGHAPQEPA